MGGWSKAGPDAITRAYRMDEANSAEHHNSRASSFRGGRPPTCSGECGRARIGSLACLLTEWLRAGRDGHEWTDHPESHRRTDQSDRKSVVEGKSVSVSVDLGGRRLITKQTNKQNTQQESQQ